MIFEFEEEPVNHDRWLISYADFITLLFGFFVVMYAVSSLNEGKYKVLSHSLTEVFTNTSTSINPIDLGVEKTSLIELPVPTSGQGQGENDAEEAREFVEYLDGLSESLISSIEKANVPDHVDVKRNDKWLEITLSDKFMFGSGDAELQVAVKPALRQIAQLLHGSNNPIKVEGFTDNLPIETEQFASNWELSATRAAAVVRYFASLGVDQSRMAAIGYGSYQAVASNKTAAGRRANRRVVIRIEQLSQARKKDLPATYDLLAPAKNRYKNKKQLQNSKILRFEKTNKPDVSEVRLKGGGLRFTNEPKEKSTK